VGGKFGFSLLPLGGLRPQITSSERMFPLVLDVNSYIAACSTPPGILPALAGRKPKDVAPSQRRLVLIDEAVLSMTQRPLLTTPIQKEKG